MNQILVTEKLYVTPEIKRKKKIYKFNFILSIIIVFVLCLFYARSEYAKSREQEISQQILEQLIKEEEETTEEEKKIAKKNEGVWKIMIESTRQNEIDEHNQNSVDNIQQTNITNNATTVEQTAQSQTIKTKIEIPTETNKKRTTTYKVNGKRYQSLGRIKIPKIGVDNVILDEPKDEEQMVEWLRISPCKFYGADPNEIGNCSIAGHNYRNKRFFSKVPNLENDDKIEITDASGRKVVYSVFEKYEVEPNETDCIYRNIEGKRMITLITCTDDSKKRVIVHALEV